MLAAVKGYYNGSHIVINEDINLSTGQEVIVTILDTQSIPEKKIILKKIHGQRRENVPYRCTRLYKGDAEQ